MDSPLIVNTTPETVFSPAPMTPVNPSIPPTGPKMVKKSIMYVLIVANTCITLILWVVFYLYFDASGSIAKLEEENTKLQNEITTLQSSVSGEIEKIKNEAKMVIEANEKIHAEEIEKLKSEYETSTPLNAASEAEGEEIWEELTPTTSTATPTVTSVDYEALGSKMLDSSRVLDLASISLTLLKYYTDNSTYPTTDIEGCFTFEDTQRYFSRGVPRDPDAYHTNDGCKSPGYYSYRTFDGADGSQKWAAGTTLSDSSIGNSSKPISAYSDSELESFEWVKWSGKYYIVNW